VAATQLIVQSKKETLRRIQGPMSRTRRPGPASWRR
jgi:hypothetical protein